MPSSQAILEIDFDTNNKEEVHLPEQLIKEFQDLNDKIDQTIVRIKSKRKRSLAKINKEIKK